MAKTLKNKTEELEPRWFKKYHEDSKNHLGALKEHFTDSVKAVGEKVDLLEEKMGHGFIEVNKTLNSHTEMIAHILLQLEEIKGELKQKVYYQDFVKLERRVAVLETNRR